MPNRQLVKDDNNVYGYRLLKIGKRAQANDDDNNDGVWPVVAATDQPVKIWDYEYGYIDEVLVMEGARDFEKIPLLNSHGTYDLEDVLGSFFLEEKTDTKMKGNIHVSETEQTIRKKIEEKHITDTSIGYKVFKRVYIDENESGIFGGKEYQGPVLITNEWEPIELSLTAIGADSESKIQGRAKNMPKEKEGDGGDNAIIEERKRVDEIYQLCQKYEVTDNERSAYVEKGMSITEIKADILDKVPEKRMADTKGSDEIRQQETRQQDYSALETLCRNYKIPDEVRENALKKPVSQARADIFAYMERNAPVIISSGRTAGEKLNEAATHAIMVRKGLEAGNREIASDLAGYRMHEIARLYANGSDVKSMVGRAFTTSDFPDVLKTVAHHAMMEGFESASEEWETWCGVGSVSDFKETKGHRTGRRGDLPKVPEGTEYGYGNLGAEHETYFIDTYGEIFVMTRQAIINDDMRIFDLPKAYGETASKTSGAVAIQALTEASKMGDGNDLFCESHKNVSATQTEFTVMLLSKIETAMSEQTDVNGNKLNITPVFVIANKTHKLDIMKVINASFIPSGTADAPNQGYYNPYKDGLLVPVFDARIPKDAIYIAAGKGKTIIVFFLDGMRDPRLEYKKGWDVDGTEMKVSLDVGAKAMDWRGLYKIPISSQ